MKRPAWSTIVIYLILGVTSLVILYPMLFMLLATFTTPEQYYRTSTFPIPDIVDLRNYAAILINCQDGCVYTSMLLTFARVLWYICVTLVVAVFGGYALARLRFAGRDGIFLFLLTGMMVPAILIMLPLYIMMARFPLAGGNDILGQGGSGVINTLPALFMLGLVEIVPLFLVKQNYEMIPAEYEEAARVDGAGTLRIIFQIYVPMLKPTLTAVSILVFISVWNDYLGPLIYVGGNKDITPIALTVQRLIYRYTQAQVSTIANFPVIFAGATLMSLPPIAMYFALQRYFVQGLVGVGING